MNSVPWLRSGTGTTPADGGCIMQVIDWIHRGEWTDDPPCVHPALRRVAIKVNDSLDDAGRQRLLDLAPRLMGTASNDPDVHVGLAVFAARRVLHFYEAVYPGDDRPRKAIEAAESGSTAAAAAEANAAEAATNATNAAARAAAYATNAAARAAAYAAYAAARAAYAAAYAAACAAYAAAYAAEAAACAAEAATYAAYAAYAAASRFDLLVAMLDEHDRITGRQSVEAVDWAPVCVVMAFA